MTKKRKVEEPTSLLKLTDREFENFVFDICQSSGIENSVWRTPGADGGRDIEGVFIRSDFSGKTCIENWYIECKRHAASLAWPVIFEKISYATNQQADFLLIASTSPASPKCQDEIAQWNSQTRRPQIRVWGPAELAQITSRHPEIALKYGVGNAGLGATTANAFLPLARLMARAAQSAYAVVAEGPIVSPEIEVTSALAELFLVRLDDARTGRGFSLSGVDLGGDSYEWISYEAIVALRDVDRYDFRAILTAAKLLWRSSEIAVSRSAEGALIIVPRTSFRPIDDAGRKFLTSISVWTNLEVTTNEGAIVATGRGANV